MQCYLSSEYEGIVSTLTQDLKFSQAREMQAVKSLNDSLRESDIEKMKLVRCACVNLYTL